MSNNKDRYTRNIKGVDIDIYDIAEAYGLVGVHYEMVKKILCPGGRNGGKSALQDLTEARGELDRKIAYMAPLPYYTWQEAYITGLQNIAKGKDWDKRPMLP